MHRPLQILTVLMAALLLPLGIQGCPTDTADDDDAVGGLNVNVSDAAEGLDTATVDGWEVVIAVLAPEDVNKNNLPAGEPAVEPVGGTWAAGYTDTITGVPDGTFTVMAFAFEEGGEPCAEGSNHGWVENVEIAETVGAATIELTRTLSADDCDREDPPK